MMEWMKKNMTKRRGFRVFVGLKGWLVHKHNPSEAPLMITCKMLA